MHFPDFEHHPRPAPPAAPVNPELEFAHSLKALLDANIATEKAKASLVDLEESLQNRPVFRVGDLSVFHEMEVHYEEIEEQNRIVQTQQHWLAEQLTPRGVDVLRRTGRLFQVAHEADVYSLQLTPGGDFIVRHGAS